jgi:putative transposase
VAFINDHRELFGVEPICRLLAIAPSSYYARQAIADNPDLASKRAKRDLQNCKDIQRVYEENRSSYGARKVWHALLQEGKEIARCTVERLMKNMNLQGVVRGKKVITTNPDTSAPCPQDKVQRDFNAPHPNFLWVSDFTYVSTWQGTVYVAFVIDVFARRIVGWKVSSSMTSSFVLDALNQAICQRRPFGNPDNKLIHHSDRGSQYLSIKYTERLAEMGIAPSVGSVGDSYDNALAECVIGLFKTEVINRQSSWKSMGQVEWETLKWMDWYNNKRLFGPIGYITPKQAEENYYANIKSFDKVA